MQRIIKNELILKPIDSILFQQQFLIVTDPENPKVVCISYETENLTFVLEDLACPFGFGLCQFGNHVLLLNKKSIQRTN